MVTRLTLSLCLMAPLAATAGTPIAEVLCAPRDEMVQRLKGQYGARLSGMGLRNVEMVMEIWTDPRGEWTLVQSYTDGKSCILAMGEGWETMPLPDPA
jgi:hypothetical protein